MKAIIVTIILFGFGSANADCKDDIYNCFKGTRAHVFTATEIGTIKVNKCLVGVFCQPCFSQQHWDNACNLAYKDKCAGGCFAYSQR